MNGFIKIVGTLAALAVSVPMPVIAQSTGYAQEVIDTEEPQWITVNLESAGSLGVEVLYKVDKLSDVQHLRVSGPLNDADWTTMKNMTSIVNLDLSEAYSAGIPSRNFENRTTLQSILFPTNLETVGSYCFYKSGLVSVAIPKSVISIGEYCFNNCKSLVTVDIDGVTTLPLRCFQSCDNLTKVILHDGLKQIAGWCFEWDRNLSEIILPSTMEVIEDGAFADCKSLTEIIFPEGMKNIDGSAFHDSGLLKAILPIQLSNLGGRAFRNCTDLEEIRLPATVFSYSSQFSGCSKIKKIMCTTATPPAINGDPFWSLSRENVTLYVPDFAIVAYKLDPYWLQFENIEGSVTSDFYALNSTLSLTNNRRMEGTPSLDILKGGSLVVGGSAPMPLNHLVIKEDFYSNQFGFGQLLNSSPAMTANSVTLSMYCDGNRWYFISMPCDVKLSNIKNVDDASFVFRYYDGESRAANGTGSSWKDVPVDGTLQAGRAYIYQTDRNSTIEFTLDVTGIEGLLASGHRTVPVNAWTSENPANAGWNLIGNPSLTYFDMASTSLTCPITVWDSYNRRYVAYSLIDDDVVLYPTQAFFMQQIGENGEITFDAKGRQLTSEVSRPAAVAAAGIARRVIFNLELVVAGDASSDRTRIVLNDDASLDYECGRDASKFFADGGEVVEFFTMDGSGNRLAINERPEGDCRVRLGLYAPGASTLTISAPRLDGEAVLHDAVTGRYVDLRKENSYTFDVDSRGFVLDRFSITVRKPTSGIGEITGEDDMKVAVDGNILTVVGVKGLPVIVYALDGRVAAVADSCETHSFTLPAGMYVVKAGKTAVKCIIR